MTFGTTSSSASDIGKLVLRLTLGVLLLLHGIAKIRHGVGGIEGMVQNMGLPGALAYGVYVGEVLAPVLVLVGWYARIGALLIIINMLFAILLAHADELLALNRHGGWALELQGMYLFAAVALLFTGPGRLSLNRK